MKSTHSSGALDHRLKLIDLAKLEEMGLRQHEIHLVRAAWRVGARPGLAHLHLRRHAQNYGYRGVCLTHSRRYSTTFTALRTARHAHRRQQSGRAVDDAEVSSFRYDGRGFLLHGDVVIARWFYEREAEMRRIGWEEVTSVPVEDMARIRDGDKDAGEP